MRHLPLLLRTTVIGLALAFAGLAWTGLSTQPRPLGAFDADRIADLEVEMWKAYYAKSRVRLFSLLVVTLREQYGFSWVAAGSTGLSLAKAAVIFGDATDHYERAIPDLTRGFARIQASTAAHFDPSAVARAELAWWVARRIPGQDSPEQVGELIAELYGALYGTPVALMREAGTLRARAAVLRDEQATEPDWVTIRGLLRRSYQSLHQQLNEG